MPYSANYVRLMQPYGRLTLAQRRLIEILEKKKWDDAKLPISEALIEIEDFLEDEKADKNRDSSSEV